MLSRIKQNFSKMLFIGSVAILLISLAFGYGLYSGTSRNQVFTLFRSIWNDIQLVYNDVVIRKNDDILYTEVASAQPEITTYTPGRLNEGLILIMGAGKDRKFFVRVIDRDGDVIHEWLPDWFEIWGNEGSFPYERRPQSQPGAQLHGAELLKSGDLVFNFEHLSTIRMNPCGKIVWKLDNLGHHSVHVAEDGIIWVSAENFYKNEEVTGYENHIAPLRSWTLQKISPDGKILDSIEVIDILKKNDLYGLLYLSSISNRSTQVTGDTLHLNDIETFPSTFQSQIFASGDVMFSLRNINTVMVMDPNTHRIKFRASGQFVRQHDPDFMDGDRISVMDNRNILDDRNLSPSQGFVENSSRIVELDVRNGKASVALDGSGAIKFFTDIMGNHQRLPNSNILVNSAREGRVFEVLPDGTLAWEYRNRVSAEDNGIVTMGMILPPEMDKAFFEALAATCN